MNFFVLQFAFLSMRMSVVYSPPTHTQSEAVERVSVDSIQFGHQCNHKLHHGACLSLLSV